MSTLTIAEAVDRYGVDVLDHLDRTVTIPVVDGPQCQGDLLVLPVALAKRVTVRKTATWLDVPAAGLPVVRGEAGGNTHTLLGGRWTTDVDDLENLALGVVDVPAGTVAYLAHPEHAYAGIAPGLYVIRRQREQADIVRLVAD